MTHRPRRAGSRWRVLLHQALPGRGYGNSHHIKSDRRFGCGPGREEHDTTITADGVLYHQRVQILAGYELDEVVVGRFLHLEAKDTNQYWLNVAGITIWVDADREGRPHHVQVYGPGEYDDPVPGCRYEATWGVSGDA